MEKYLITGFSGFVCYHFLNYLNSVVQQKVEVLGLDITPPVDFTTDSYRFSNISLRFISLNLIDYKSLEIAITSFQPTRIVHLASLSSVSESWKKPIDCFMNNTNIFLNVVEAIRINHIDCRVLSVGSSEEYGNVPIEKMPLKETMTLSPISPYAIARVSQEMLSNCYVQSFSADIVLTRSFNHIGPRQRDQFVIPCFVKQIIEGKKRGDKEIVLHTGDVSIVRDFLDVRDVARAYYLLFNHGISGELYNVCSGSGYSLSEIVQVISEMVDIKVNVVIDSDKIRPNDNKVIIGDNSKIFSHTAWKPKISIEESIHDLIMYWDGLIH
jgi:GDP-4-dehydro-6-deoxy-D-mannose reductase